MRGSVWLVLVVSAILTLALAAGCGGGEQRSGANPTARPGSTDAGKPANDPLKDGAAAKPSAGWEDVPVYPGAKTLQQMNLPGANAGDQFSKVEWRYYSTGDAAAKVIEYYKAETAKKGWKEVLFMAAGQGASWGMYEKGNAGFGVWITGEGQNATNIGVWRGEKSS